MESGIKIEIATVQQCFLKLPDAAEGSPEEI